MRNYLKMFVALSVLAAGMISFSNANAQCSAKEEIQVRNFEEAEQWLTIDSKEAVYEDHVLIGYKLVANVAKGHKKGGSGCCNFNKGRCGKSSAMEFIVDRDNNIISGNVKLYSGVSDEGPFIRWEDFADYDK